MPRFLIEVNSARPFSLGARHNPYMVLPHGGTGPFSCANCDAFERRDGALHCRRGEFLAWNGSSMLPDENGTPLDDASRACSDWFQPRR